jgi:DNA-binding NarL/FixJ family response regulator
MTGGGSIRVALADDQLLVRAGFRALLQAEDDLDVVGEASTGEELLDIVRRQPVDVVLMDIRMPGGDGLWATEQSRACTSSSSRPSSSTSTSPVPYERARAGSS